MLSLCLVCARLVSYVRPKPYVPSLNQSIFVRIMIRTRMLIVIATNCLFVFDVTPGLLPSCAPFVR